MSKRLLAKEYSRCMLRLTCCVLMALAAIPAALAQSNAQSTKENAPSTKDEDRIYDEVRRVLAQDRDVRGAAIVVEVKGGNVRLSGRIRNEKAREKAAKLAKKVKGVATVEILLKLPSDP